MDFGGQKSCLGNALVSKVDKGLATDLISLFITVTTCHCTMLSSTLSKPYRWNSSRYYWNYFFTNMSSRMSFYINRTALSTKKENVPTFPNYIVVVLLIKDIMSTTIQCVLFSCIVEGIILL